MRLEHHHRQVRENPRVLRVREKESSRREYYTLQPPSLYRRETSTTARPAVVWTTLLRPSLDTWTLGVAAEEKISLLNDVRIGSVRVVGSAAYTTVHTVLEDRRNRGSWCHCSCWLVRARGQSGRESRNGWCQRWIVSKGHDRFVLSDLSVIRGTIFFGKGGFWRVLPRFGVDGTFRWTCLADREPVRIECRIVCLTRFLFPQKKKYSHTDSATWFFITGKSVQPLGPARQRRVSKRRRKKATKK